MDLELQFITFVISSGFEVTIDFFYDSFGRRVRLIYHKYRVGLKLRSKSKELSITLSSFLQSVLRFEVWKKNFKPNPLNWVMEFDVQTPKVAIFETSTIHVSN